MLCVQRRGKFDDVKEDWEAPISSVKLGTSSPA
jgi:hypothetical protein